MNKPGIEQNPQVSGDARLAHAKDPDQLVDVERARMENARYTKSRFVAKSSEATQKLLHERSISINPDILNYVFLGS